MLKNTNKVPPLTLKINLVTISTIYCPPKHLLIAQRYFNAKYPMCDDDEGHRKVKSMSTNNLRQISRGEPINWPSEKNKMQSRILLGFIIRPFTGDNTLHSKIAIKERQPFLHNNRTNWNLFREKLDETIYLECPLKTEIVIEMAVEGLTRTSSMIPQRYN